MGKSIIIHHQNDLVIGTWELSKGFGVEHRAVKKLVNKYKHEFEQLGVVTPAVQQPASKKGGRKIQEYLLSEPQATYASTLLTNNETVRKFKIFLTKEFFRQRKILSTILSQKQNAEWLQKREEGKTDRRAETDAIKKFVEYAQSQGSQNAQKYYLSISKMQNRTLFNLDFLSEKFPNIRDVVSGFALSALSIADHIIAKALQEGMEAGMHYKEIYCLAKQRLEIFTEVLGKMPLHVALKEPHLLEVAVAHNDNPVV